MGLKTRWLRTAGAHGQKAVLASGWSMAVHGQRTRCTAVGFRRSQIEERLLSSMGYRWNWWMIRPSESSTSSYIRSTQSKEGRTPSGLRCVAGYLLDTKALGEHSRILTGGGMATWAAACCLSSRRLFRLTHLNDLVGRQLSWVVPLKRCHRQLRRLASLPPEVCGLLDVRGADAAKVADRLWATRIFQATYAEMETRLPPYHHRWGVQTAGGVPLGKRCTRKRYVSRRRLARD